MKKIIRKIKNWLIGKLGGYTVEDVHKRCDNHVGDFVKLHAQIVGRWRKAVQEICRRSENSYYDWCCEYCAENCDKHNGWCEKFTPRIGANNERRSAEES